MKELINGLYAIAVEKEAFDIKVDFYEPYFGLRYKTAPNIISSKPFMFKDFGGRKNYPTAMDIVGIWEDGKADFDVDPFIEKWKDSSKYINYEHKWLLYSSARKSFNSLILSKGFKESDKLVIIKKL